VPSPVTALDFLMLEDQTALIDGKIPAHEPDTFVSAQAGPQADQSSKTRSSFCPLGCGALEALFGAANKVPEKTFGYLFIDAA